MHLLESYALVMGKKIFSCFIHEEEIELPLKKYITFHSEHDKGTSRNYHKWGEVINLLLKNKNFDYEIVQIGQNNKNINKNINNSYVGKTNYHSLAYLIKNSEMHLGYDSLPVHIASHFGKKIVAIYPQYKSYTGPYFSKKEDVIIIEPPYPINPYSSQRVKPSYSFNCNLMNSISPQYIYKSVLKILNIDE